MNISGITIKHYTIKKCRDTKFEYLSCPCRNFSHGRLRESRFLLCGGAVGASCYYPGNHRQYAVPQLGTMPWNLGSRGYTQVHSQAGNGTHM